MLRRALLRGTQLGAAAVQGFGSRTLQTSAATGACSGTSITSMIKAVNGSTASSLLSGGLTSIKAAASPQYAAKASTGMSYEAKLLVALVVGWNLYRLDTQARANEWIVDLSLDVLQAAWLISYASFLPFRSIFLALRGMAPATAGQLQALRTSVFLKP